MQMKSCIQFLLRIAALAAGMTLLVAGKIKGVEEKQAMETITFTAVQFDGTRGEVWPDADKLPYTDKLTVSAWVTPERMQAERMQVVAAKWALRETFDAFDAYDAGRTAGLDTTGFLGAVFDGRYMYFVPQHNTERRHGVVLRYDTQAEFNSPAAWTAYDAENTSGLVTRGYYGAVFDGNFIYFTPRHDGMGPGTYHTRILRYDTRLPFLEENSWSAFDAGLDNSYQGCAFDGQYVYFAPGANRDKTNTWPAPVLRYDTRQPFAERASYEIYELSRHPGLENTRVDLDGIAFDGRYMYFAPIIGDLVVRFDTHRPFEQSDSWDYFMPPGLQRCVGPVFDGRHVYFGGYDTHNVVRYDTRAEFKTADAWECVDMKREMGAPFAGYDGGFCDGRYVYFVPFVDHQPGLANFRTKFHGIAARYDTLRPFNDGAAWDMADVSEVSGMKTVGYNAGATDGRYLYFAPWHDGAAYYSAGKIIGHGRVLRYDTTGTDATFVLKYMDYGHNGGLSGAIPGPTFSVNTDRGVFSARANRLPPAGRVHLAGVYDGGVVKLYINGELVNKQPAAGRLCVNDVPAMIGELSRGGAGFAGKVENLTIGPYAASADQVKAVYNGRAP